MGLAQNPEADNTTTDSTKASAYSISTDLDKTEALLKSLLSETSASNSPLAYCYLKLATLHHQKGNLWKSLGYYGKSDSVFSLLGDSAQLSIVFSNRSAIYSEIEQFDLALKDVLLAIQIATKNQDSLTIAKKRFNLGNLYMKMQLLDKALIEYENVLAIFKRHGTVESQANLLGNIGGIMVYKGHFNKARKLFMRSLKIYEEIASERGLTYANSHLGFFYENQNSLDSALYRYNQSYYWAHLSEDMRSEAQALGHLAIISHQQRKYEQSIAFSKDQISMLTELSDSVELKTVYRRLAETFREQRNTSEALNAMVLYDDLQRALDAKFEGQLLRKARMQHKLGMVAQKLKAREQEAQLKDLNLARKQAWLITLVALLITVLLAGTAFYRIRRNKLKVKAMVLEQQLLRSKTNPHFVFNVFNSIQSYFLANRASEGQLYLRKFAQLMRLYFEFTELKEISLREELKEVDLYVEVEKMRLQTPLQCSVEMVDGIDLDNVLVPPFLLHTYVENAIWHGFIPTQEKAKITIEIQKRDTLLQITVVDNGIGINESQRRKTGNNSHHSEGLKLNERRLTGMKNQKPSASVQVKDLSEGGSNVSGTEVTIKIPLD